MLFGCFLLSCHSLCATWYQTGTDRGNDEIAAAIMASGPQTFAACNHRDHETRCDVSACVTTTAEAAARQAAAATAQGVCHPVFQSPPEFTPTGPCDGLPPSDKCHGVRTTWGPG